MSMQRNKRQTHTPLTVGAAYTEASANRNGNLVGKTGRTTGHPPESADVVPPYQRMLGEGEKDRGHDKTERDTVIRDTLQIGLEVEAGKHDPWGALQGESCGQRSRRSHSTIDYAPYAGPRG